VRSAADGVACAAAAGQPDLFADVQGFALKVAEKFAREITILRVEVFLGVFIGAVTFTGSVIAYGKLAGKVDTKAIQLPGGHMLNAGAAALSFVLLLAYVGGRGPGR
jgi:H+-translocating NAD(P) transhydrogenase subunit beta